MEINVVIDEITNCLVLRETGEEVETEYKLVKEDITAQKAKQLIKQGWLFDWSKPQKDGNDIYQLFIKGQNEIQGMVAFRNIPEDYLIYLDLVEVAPPNRGKTGKYIGCGGHLFAIACQKSIELGNDGYVKFRPKTILKNHYIEALRAIDIDGTYMYIDTNGANYLVNKYLKK